MLGHRRRPPIRSAGRPSTSRSSSRSPSALLAGAAGYWGVVEAPDLVRSPNDAAVIAAARTVPRGRILDRDGKVLADNKTDANGELYRVYAEPAISQVVGYASRDYGRAGLERTYDAELTGLAGDPVERRVRQVRRRPLRPEGPDAVAVATTSSGRPSRRSASDAARSSCSTRDRRGPGARLDADLRRLGDRRPGDGRRRRSRRSRPTRPSRCCRGRRWAATCPGRCSRS